MNLSEYHPKGWSETSPRSPGRPGGFIALINGGTLVPFLRP